MERRPDPSAGSEPAPAGSPRGAGPGCGAGASAVAAPPTSIRRVPIGIAAVDCMLGGGIPPGIIVDVFGSHGTGKTQIMMQAAARFAACGRRVLFVDTAGTFRPERVLDMAGTSARPEAILDRISVVRVQSVTEQTGVVARLLLQQPQTQHGPTTGFDLVAVDSLTDLFSYEYSRYGDLRERNRLFFGYMRGLARLAVHRGVTVMTSNVVRTSGDVEVENMAAEVDMFAHVRIRLARGEVDSAAAAARAAGKVLYGNASCVMLDSLRRNGGGGRDGRPDNPDNNNHGGNHNDKSDCRAHTGNYGPAHDHKGSGRDVYGVKFSYRIESGGITTFDRDSDPSRSGINLP